MGMPRYAARGDANEPELIEFARNLGWTLWKMDTPADWLGLRRGKWEVIEVKNPDCEGDLDEFTAEQKIFSRDVFVRSGKILIWRTKDDVLRDSNARVTA